MKMLKTLILVMILPTFAYANPAPFGLQIGQASIKDMQAKYSADYSGINKYSMGKMFSLPVAKLGVKGLTEATAIFDKNEKLVAVLMTLPKHRFDSMYASLKSKYRVKSKQIPFVGDKKVIFKDGSTEITASAPHLSFKMSLNYINDDFYKSYLKASKAEQNREKQRETSNL